MRTRLFTNGSLALAATALSLASTANADTLVTYLYDTWTPTAETRAFDTGSVTAHLTASVLSEAVLLSETARSGFSAGTGSFFANTDQLDSVEPAFNATSDYIAFTLTVADGYTMKLSSLSFKLGASATGATGYAYTANAALRTSLNTSLNVGTASSTFATLPTYTTPASIQYQNKSIDLSAPSLQSVTGSITFYLYLWDSTGGTNETLRIDDINLSGSVTATAIPEPSVYAVILGMSVLGATLTRRRRL